MVYKRFYIQIIIRIILLSLTCLWLAFELTTPPYIYTTIFLGSLIILQVVALIHYVNKTNRELAKFFVSLKDKDSSFSLDHSGKMGSFRELASVLNETRELIQHTQLDREKQYKYLQFIFEHVDIGLISFSPDGTVIHFNQAAKKLLMITDLKKINNLNPIHPEFENVLRKITTEDSEVIQATLGENQVRILIKSTEFRFEDEWIKLVSLQDVKKELEESELQSWQRLIRVLTHEIMNSLTPIKTLTHAIKRSIKEGELTGSDKQAEEHAINDLVKNTELIEDRSSGLIDFVKKYKDITSIRKLSLTNVNLRKLFENIHAFFREEMESKNIVCKHDTRPTDLELTCDKHYIEQVLINLVKNSIDALDEATEPLIHMKAFRNEVNRIVIQVSDNGKGIPPEKKNDIFTPFYTTKKSGSGIGLTFSRHIMQLHGGSIDVQSGQKTKTVVSLRF